MALTMSTGWVSSRQLHAIDRRHGLPGTAEYRSLPCDIPLIDREKAIDRRDVSCKIFIDDYHRIGRIFFVQFIIACNFSYTNPPVVADKKFLPEYCRRSQDHWPVQCIEFST
jgi:hypothetical protein